MRLPRSRLRLFHHLIFDSILQFFYLTRGSLTAVALHHLSPRVPVSHLSISLHVSGLRNDNRANHPASPQSASCGDDPRHNNNTKIASEVVFSPLQDGPRVCASMRLALGRCMSYLSLNEAEAVPIHEAHVDREKTLAHYIQYECGTELFGAILQESRVKVAFPNIPDRGDRRVKIETAGNPSGRLKTKK